ncbi:hypothetical protein HDE_03700 [Halotydeus destructor]|nr:hypothetical protein HDE_03700 [Halotydeus destructor]
MKGFEDEMAQTSSSNEQQETLDLYSSKFLSENSVETLLDKSILYSEFFNTSYTRCACDEQTGGNLCETYDNQIATFQVAGKKCFTLFHGTDKEEVNKFTANMDYSTAPVILSNEAHIGDAEPSQVRLHRKELIRFHINFGSNDTVALNTQSQATMLIHDNFVVPAMQTKHVIQLKPGYYYQIYIQAQETILLEPPFDSRCRNYLEGRKGTNKKLHPILDTPSSRADCMTGCLGKHTMNACKCWPPELPYVSTFNTTHENNLTLCDWKTNRFGKSSSLQQPEHRADFEHCFAQFTEGCSVKCDNDCIQLRYSSQVTKALWPSDEVIKTAGVNDSRWRDLRECCATISVRYAVDEKTVYQSIKKFEIIEFISYVCGLISLWLGFSVIGMYDYFNFFYHHVADKFGVAKTRAETNRLQPVYITARIKHRE